MFKDRISIFLPALLLVGFLFLAIPEDVSAQDPTFGSCCVLSQDECVTCDFFGCAYSKTYCEQELGGDFDAGAGGVCVDDSDRGPRCGDGDPELEGCCVIGQGNCRDGVIRENCFDDQGEGADFWVFGASCEEVPECKRQKSVPTIDQWGLIVTAGILGVIGFIMVLRRRKATA